MVNASSLIGIKKMAKLNNNSMNAFSNHPNYLVLSPEGEQR